MLTHSYVNSSIPDKIVKVQLREVIDKARRRKDDQRAMTRPAAAAGNGQQQGGNNGNSSGNESRSPDVNQQQQRAESNRPNQKQIQTAEVASDHSDSEDEGGAQEPEIEQPRSVFTLISTKSILLNMRLLQASYLVRVKEHYGSSLLSYKRSKSKKVALKQVKITTDQFQSSTETI